MAITFPLASGKISAFTAAPELTADVGSGSNRKIVLLIGNTDGALTPGSTATVGAQTVTLSSVYTDGTGKDWRYGIDDLSVSGSQTITPTFAPAAITGASYMAVLVVQGDAALTIDGITSLLEQTTGGGGGSLSRTVTTTSGDTAVVVMGRWVGATDPTATSGSTLITSAVSGIDYVRRVASGSSTAPSFDYAAFHGGVSLGFAVREASAPVLSSPTGTATGPTQATIGVTSDTAPTTTAISYQILPAATAAPSASTIVGAPDGTISTGSAGVPLTKAIAALTTDTAVKVHFAQGATSNVVSSESFTPNTLASSGSPSAQTGTAGGSITWAGATPDSLITNHGNGSGSWSIVSSAGFTVAPSINSATGVLSGGTFTTTAGSYAPQIRYTDSSTVPAAQTITLTISLTVSAGAVLSGGATLDDITASGTLASAQGTVTSQPLKRNNGALVPAASTLTWLGFRAASTGAPVLLKTSVTLDGSSRFAVSDPALTPGASYTCEWLESTGQRGRGMATAA